MSFKSAPEEIAELLRTMQTLRSPGGCPWDAEQTPESLTLYILEEACELIDAIESGQTELIKDELGDLLLQVVFQAQIFKERGEFDFADVAAAINAKLLRRHPHVFEKSGDLFDDIDLTRQWDEIKGREKTQKLKTGQLSDHLPSRLPSLQKAQKLFKTMGRSDQVIKIPSTAPHKDGRKWTVDQKADKLDEETLGWGILKWVELAHHAGLDAESALRKTIHRLVKHLESVKPCQTETTSAGEKTARQPLS